MTEEPPDTQTAEPPTEEVPDPPAWATVPRSRSDGRRPPAPPPAEFPLALRGYDRAAVDEYVEEVGRVVGELEATRMRTPAVRRALEEVGEQTAEILRKAHETAEEITARSRSQAGGRLERAEREAAAIRREAEEAARQLEADNQGLWEERRRLIEEVRAMAQDVLAVADAALDRLPDRGDAAATSGEEEAGAGD